MDFEQEIRRMKARLMGLVTRGTLVSSGGGKVLSGSVRWMGKRVSANTEVLQPHGLFLKVPAGAEGLAAGDRSAAVMVGAARRADSPGAGELADGEGGLYYAGTFKVYMGADGTVALGDKEPTDWVALASLVDERIAAIQEAFDAHTHPVATTGSATAQTGTAAVTTGVIGPLDSVASEVIKAM